jgi:hypothetical protein
MGAEGYPYGFDVTTEDGKPLVSFAYASRALAEAAATHLESALLNAISVHPYAEKASFPTRRAFNNAWRARRRLGRRTGCRLEIEGRGEGEITSCVLD